MIAMAAFRSVAGPYPKLRPMHPKPSAETSSPLFPNVRFCIISPRSAPLLVFLAEIVPAVRHGERPIPARGDFERVALIIGGAEVREKVVRRCQLGGDRRRLVQLPDILQALARPVDLLR